MKMHDLFPRSHGRTLTKPNSTYHDHALDNSTWVPKTVEQYNKIVGVSASDVFLEGMAADERSRGSIRGIGALDLNTRHCDETQRKLHERDRLRIR